MSLRPAPARWFELLVPRDALPAALAALSRTAAVQLESRGAAAHSTVGPIARGASGAIAAALARVAELRRRYAAYWPAPRLETERGSADAETRLEQALHVIEDWTAHAAPRVAAIEELERERTQLRALGRFSELARDRTPRLDRLARAGPQLAARLWRLAPAAEAPIPPIDVLLQIESDEQGTRYVLAVGLVEAIEEFERTLPAAQSEPIALPPWLATAGGDTTAAIAARAAAIEQTLPPLRDEVLRLSGSTRLEAALGDVAFVEWFSAEVPELEYTPHFAWITGWLRTDRQAQITSALEAVHVPWLMRHPEPPPQVEPPVTLRNPRWAAPFELFVGLLGTPGRGEADPSLVLALLVPLLFGFMFGDVGHGAVLVVVGLLARRRHPPLALLVPGGIASIAFGFAFGSLFALEDRFDALWLRPLDAPLTLLTAALALGVCIVAAGLAIDAWAHLGSGRARDWLAQRAGPALVYAGAVLALLEALAGALLGVLGVLVAIIGAVRERAAAGAARAIGRALGELIETTLQAIVNTISFLRVGAFALAHAGLCTAIVALAHAAGSRGAQLAALVLGNLFVLALEVLVVGIQTTRLVLFEFFIRFLRGTGRAFQPLAAAPPSLRPS